MSGSTDTPARRHERVGELDGSACLFVPRGADDEHVGRHSDIAIVRK